MLGVSVDGDGPFATACYLAVLIGASVGAWIGAERAPRGQRLVPRLIAAGVSLTALGDVLWELRELAGADPDVSIADPPWFASYVLLIAALWVVLSRGRRRSRCGGRVDVDFLTDVLTIVVVAVLVFWSFSVEGIVSDDSVAPLVRAVWAAYPIADAILLALIVRVLLSPNARTHIGTSFAVGACLWLAADIAYLQTQEQGAVRVVMDLAWMLGPVLMARAAWRVDTALVDPPGSTAVDGSVAQLVIAIGPLLVPPALELMADLRGEPDQPLMLFTGTSALITLAVVRTARLIRSEQRARRALETAHEVALEASRAKSMFLANVSHEIRTPLTTVLAAGELLQTTPLDELQTDLLGRMNRSGEILRTLVESLLDLSRVEAGRLELASTAFDLPAMVSTLAEVYEPRAAQAGLGFQCVIDPAVPHTVTGDRDRLVQVLTNLLDNALKFTPTGHVGLLVRTLAGNPGTVELVVDDTGIGIASREQHAVFEAFHQVDGSSSRQYGGTGLGLAICKELIELMGGSIRVRSRLGNGSMFVVRVPLTMTPAVHAQVRDRRIRQVSR